MGLDREKTEDDRKAKATKVKSDQGYERRNETREEERERPKHDASKLLKSEPDQGRALLLSLLVPSASSDGRFLLLLLVLVLVLRDGSFPLGSCFGGVVVLRGGRKSGGGEERVDESVRERSFVDGGRSRCVDRRTRTKQNDATEERKKEINSPP